MLYRWCY